MVKITETPLPGVGARFDLRPGAGPPLGVVSRPSGRRDLVVYDRDDPDAVAVNVPLAADEAAALGQLLGATTITEELEQLPAVVHGLAIDWCTLAGDAAHATIGELAIRTATGASVLAIVRDDAPIPAPGPDEALRAGDVVLLAGTPAGIAAAVALLTT